MTFDTDYSKLPASPPIDLVYLLDPLIATGGTATAALHMITDWGIPSVYALSTRVDLIRTISSKQDQAALYPGV